MKIKLIILLTITLIITSCSKSKKEKKQQEKTETSLPIIKIRPPEGELPNLKLSEIAEDIKYIKLETTDNCLLSYGKVHYSKNSKYMFIKSNHKLYQFDTSGKFIKKIGRKGQGPNEFILQKLAVDFKKEILYIFSRYKQNTILKFNFEGKPLKKIKNELIGYPDLMKEFNNQLLCVNEISPHLRKSYKGGYMETFSLNPSTNKINYYLPNKYYFKPNTRSVKYRNFNHLEVFDKEAYYWLGCKDTIYKLTTDTIKPYLILDFGKYKFKYEYLAHLYNINYLSYIKEKLKNVMMPTSMLATKNHLLFGVSKVSSINDRYYFLVVYNKITQKYKLYNNKIINDLDGGVPIYLSSLTTPSNLIYTMDRLKNPDDIMYKDNKKYPLKFPERKNELKKILDNSDIEDNPIIPIITMREDF